MPVNERKMHALKKQYGSKKGKSVYYAMETLEKHGKKPGKNKR